MELKPFISNAKLWRKHFKEISENGNTGKKYHVLQVGSGFPTNSVVSVSPIKQAEDIAKSELVEINKGAPPHSKPTRKRKSNYKKTESKKINQKRRKRATGNIKKTRESVSKTKKSKVYKKSRVLSHKRKK